MNYEKSVPLLPGLLVEVRSWPEILSTLDDSGMLEGLPFMPEMAKFCGHRFRVSKRVERTCEDAKEGMRRIRDTVFLDGLRCDGTTHGGCQKGCFIFWKEKWLRRIDQNIVSGTVPAVDSTNQYPYQYKFSDGQYVCQSTELIRATSLLSPLDLGSYLRDIRARTYSVGQLIRMVSYALFLRIRRRVTGKSYRFLEGQQTKTPKETLNLEAGEWVKVKTKDEIAATLDVEGKNRGLAFTVEMLPFCGGTFRVLRRLEKMIHEPTRKLINVEDTVILDNVTCDGCHILRGGCPRENYHYWREIWLKRTQAQESVTRES
jgi:hypothetical protein